MMILGGWAFLMIEVPLYAEWGWLQVLAEGLGQAPMYWAE